MDPIPTANDARITEINYNGKTILFVNHQGLQGEEVVKNQRLALERIKASGKRDVLFLNDLTDVEVTPDLNDELKKTGEEILKYAKKVAIVGMSTGIRYVIITIFMAMTQAPMKLFHSLFEAKTWLTED